MNINCRPNTVRSYSKLTRNEKVSLLIAFTCLAEKIPDTVNELIEQAELGQKALDWLGAQSNVLKQEDFSIVYSACLWIDIHFYNPIFEGNYKI